MLFLFAVLTHFAPVHAEAFEARVLVASTHEHQALVSLASKDTMIFGQCTLPNYYEPTRDQGAPLEAFMSCTQIGESLPNKTDVRVNLENAFKVKFAQTFDQMTGASVGTIARYSTFMGAGAGGLISGLAYLVFPRLRLAPLAAIFAGTGGAVTLSTAYVAARTAYADNGAAEVLGQINRSKVLTTLTQPLVIEEISELGLVSRRGFALARTALNEAVDEIVFQLRGIVPGGGSAGGAGASSTW